MYGTGNGADKVFEVFDELNIEVSGVTASDTFVRERYFHNFRVTPISEFLKKYEKFIVIITFGSSRPEVIENIKESSDAKSVERHFLSFIFIVYFEIHPQTSTMDHFWIPIFSCVFRHLAFFCFVFL
jgi:hypothetical protein